MNGWLGYISESVLSTQVGWLVDWILVTFSANLAYFLALRIIMKNRWKRWWHMQTCH